MTTVLRFDDIQLEEICKVLGDSATGSEITVLLQQMSLRDGDPTGTKWRRLRTVFEETQRRDNNAMTVVTFMYKVMNPVRFTTRYEEFENLRHRLNYVLIFCGYQLEQNGKLRILKAAQTLDEAAERADKLRSELRRRGVHPDVLKYCRSELVSNNYFHAVLEATKSVAEKIRQRTGLVTDGAQLVDDAFALGKSGIPMLAFNSLRTDSERNEQNGMMNLMKGMFSAFRNPTAHVPKIQWKVDEQDAFDLLTVASLLHRRIDTAVNMGRNSP